MLIKVALLSTCLSLASSYPVSVTQEQLAQYVAAQQTGETQTKPLSVRALPRPRQPYALPPANALYQAQGEALAGGPYLQNPYPPVGLSAYQQAAAAYQPEQTRQVYFQPQQQLLSQGQQLQPLRKYKPRPVAPAQKAADEENPEDYDPNPAYQFSFDVNDDENTNYHNRKEQREGDKISGSYSIVDSDGYLRTVTYTADPKEGFKADVQRQPTDIVVKLPTPPTPLRQQYQLSPHQSLLARKQQTQQYIQASSPLQQYSAAAQPQAYLTPAQLRSLGAYQQPAAYQPQAAYQALPKSAKASAVGYATSQPAAAPILYQAYQQ